MSESPPGLGYGEKALGMAHLFVMKPGASGARVTIPIRFDIPNAGGSANPQSQVYGPH